MASDPAPFSPALVLGPPTLTALPPLATREDWAWHTEPEGKESRLLGWNGRDKADRAGK